MGLEGGLRLRETGSGTAGLSPLLTIITVTLNAAQGLQQTIASVRAQPLSRLEHVIVDGGSTDATVELLRSLKNDIAYWLSEPDRGIYDAMNKGVSLAKGDYLLFLGSGDELRGPVLGPKLDFDRLLPVQVLSFWGKPRVLKLRDVRLGMPYSHQGIMFRNCALKPFDTDLRIAADYQFLLDNFDKAGLAPPDGSSGGYVWYDPSGISSTQILRRELEMARIVKNHFGRYYWMRFWLRQLPRLLFRKLWRRANQSRSP